MPLFTATNSSSSRRLLIVFGLVLLFAASVMQWFANRGSVNEFDESGPQQPEPGASMSQPDT